MHMKVPFLFSYHDLYFENLETKSVFEENFLITRKWKTINNVWILTKSKGDTASLMKYQ